MKKKPEKALGMSAEHKESLAKLYSHPDFKSLEAMFKIEENNIILQAFKVNSSDPMIAIKKAHSEGRLYTLRKILRTFESLKEKNG